MGLVEWGLLMNEFIEIVWEHYAKNGRDLLWRIPGPDGSFDPYKIMVSEIMLQQTQVPRVAVKYEEFLSQFPNTQALAKAPLSKVLIAWQGLGYNRRAKYLHEAAKKIQKQHDGKIPRNKEELIKLPGIGPNTAAAVLVYTYNSPEVFIETNIRSVFLHHFFQDRDDVTDKEILKLVEETLQESPRDWYWALMDYGTFIKRTHGNPNKRSKSYVRQSKFTGSDRQIRGMVLKELSIGSKSSKELQTNVQDVKVVRIIEALEREGLIAKTDQNYHLAN